MAIALESLVFSILLHAIFYFSFRHVRWTENDRRKNFHFVPHRFNCRVCFSLFRWICAIFFSGLSFFVDENCFVFKLYDHVTPSFVAMCLRRLKFSSLECEAQQEKRKCWKQQDARAVYDVFDEQRQRAISLKREKKQQLQVTKCTKAKEMEDNSRRKTNDENRTVQSNELKWTIFIAMKADFFFVKIEWKCEFDERAEKMRASWNGCESFSVEMNEWHFRWIKCEWRTRHLCRHACSHRSQKKKRNGRRHTNSFEWTEIYKMNEVNEYVFLIINVSLIEN